LMNKCFEKILVLHSLAQSVSNETDMVALLKLKLPMCLGAICAKKCTNKTSQTKKSEKPFSGSHTCLLIAN